MREPDGIFPAPTARNWRAAGAVIAGRLSRCLRNGYPVREPAGAKTTADGHETLNSSWDERQVLEGCRRGERAAQQELYVRTSERIYRVLLKITRDPERAFDLAQETYLKAFSKITQFDGRSSLPTWLYRIAVNEALHVARRATVADSAAKALGITQATDCEDHPPTTRLDVADALSQVSEADRAILVLRYQEGLDYAAIAAITGLTDGTIASRLNRARNRVREFLKSGYATAEDADAPAHQTGDGQNSMERDAQPGRRSTSAARAAKP